MPNQKKLQSIQFATYPEPIISRILFASKWSIPFWTITRVYLGYIWLLAGWHKITDSAWVGSDAGTAVAGFLQHSLTLTTGEHPSVQLWYAWLIENIFLPNATLMSYLVAFGQVLVGIALILGFFIGFSAFMGGVMNAAFLLAGTVSTNPQMFILATWLVLAWRVAGYWGLDYWVLPWLSKGNWRDGQRIFERDT